MSGFQNSDCMASFKSYLLQATFLHVFSPPASGLFLLELHILLFAGLYMSSLPQKKINSTYSRLLSQGMT
jgi:hypothetical protein